MRVEIGSSLTQYRIERQTYKKERSKPIAMLVILDFHLLPALISCNHLELSERNLTHTGYYIILSGVLCLTDHYLNAFLFRHFCFALLYFLLLRVIKHIQLFRAGLYLLYTATTLRRSTRVGLHIRMFGFSCLSTVPRRLHSSILRTSFQ